MRSGQIPPFIHCPAPSLHQPTKKQLPPGPWACSCLKPRPLQVHVPLWHKGTLEGGHNNLLISETCGPYQLYQPGWAGPLRRILSTWSTPIDLVCEALSQLEECLAMWPRSQPSSLADPSAQQPVNFPRLSLVPGKLKVISAFSWFMLLFHQGPSCSKGNRGLCRACCFSKLLKWHIPFLLICS